MQRIRNKSLVSSDWVEDGFVPFISPVPRHVSSLTSSIGSISIASHAAYFNLNSKLINDSSRERKS